MTVDTQRPVRFPAVPFRRPPFPGLLPGITGHLLLVLTLLILPSLAEGQEEFFQQGNQLYQEGDFAGALEAYQALRQGGFESADLYYNLANAFFKTGDLGRSILNYERALKLRPGDEDIRANLELARSITADEVEPLPRFWLFSVASWWVNLLPRNGLILTVLLGYLVGSGALCVRILSRQERTVGTATSVSGGAGVIFLLMGITLLAREGILAETRWGIILAEEVAVQSAPSGEDNLTLFNVHEGTKVRLDQVTEGWTEVVLEDGRVGWIETPVFEEI